MIFLLSLVLLGKDLAMFPVTAIETKCFYTFTASGFTLLPCVLSHNGSSCPCYVAPVSVRRRRRLLKGPRLPSRKPWNFQALWPQQIPDR